MSKHIRIAVIEDQELDKEASVNALTGHYGDTAEVIAFETVEELLDHDDGQDFDIVVLDLQLRKGVLQGNDAVKAVTQRAPVLVFSALNSGEAMYSAQKAGARGYVSKDTSGTKTLIEGVEAVLAGEDFTDPVLQQELRASTRKVLTEQQQQVLRLEALGQTAKLIAKELGIEVSTVRSHQERINAIYEDRTKGGRVLLAVELGLVSPWEPPRRYPDF
jgi:DNA-binding NarL/FixJ family response regulator